jgi:GNAT superfamily N-acetyltransferase
MNARRAEDRDVAAICRICSDGWRDTYAALYTPAEIEATIAQFYTPERVTAELVEHGTDWGGWWVAERSNGQILAAGGGGLTEPGVGELLVLYADPTLRYQGGGSAILEAVTAQQVTLGAREQWVSVGKGNAKAIPFYQARGFMLRGERPGHYVSEHNSLRYWRTLANWTATR